LNLQTTQKEWWEDFFSGPVVDSWKSYPTNELTRGEVDFLEKSLELERGASVLDVPCGAGRHSLELASRGYRATGVDYSAEFLEIARRESEERRLPVEWEHREMRDLPWEGRFGGAFCFGNSFSYLTDEGNAEFLGAARRVLSQGGRFVLETGTVAEALLPNFERKAWYPMGNQIVLMSRRLDHARSRAHTEYTFISDGKTERREASYRVYTFRELTRLVEEAGFTVVSSHSTLQGAPFELGSRNLYLVAKKS